MTTSEVRDLALGLPMTERARLARELIDSLEPDAPDPDIEQTWIDEIETRADAIEAGHAHLLDGPSSLAEIRREIHKGRQP